MPKILRINNLGQGGLNADISPWELPPSAITDGLNFRVANGALQTSGGNASMTTCPDDFKPAYVQTVVSPLGVYWLAAGQDSVQVYNGLVWEDISSWTAGMSPLNPGDEFLWQGCNLGKIPIVNNSQHYPEYWDPQSSGTDLAGLPFDSSNTWEAKSFRCRVMRAHKNFLFALNLQEGATHLQNAYRWSHPADIDGLPFTWDETDASGLAGRSQIAGNSGAIIDGLSLRDSFVIYSQNGIDILEFVGGEFVWRRRSMTSSYGLFNRDSLVEVNGVHFFLADGDVVSNDGNSVQSIMYNRIRTRLVKNANAEYYHRSFAARNDVHKEIWFCVPEGSSEFPNVAYVYNWSDQSWAIRDLPTGLASAKFGPTIVSTGTRMAAELLPSPLAAPDLVTWDTWTGNWDEQTRTWSSGAVIPPDPEAPYYDFTWSIGNSGNSYGYQATFGDLDPKLIERKEVYEVYVDSVTKLVTVNTDEELQGSDILTLTSDVNSVIVTWATDHYEATDATFADYVVAADGTDIDLRIEVTNASNTSPPATPVTASGDMLIGVRHDKHNLEMLDLSSASGDLNATIERTDLPMAGLDVVTTITRLYPHIQGTEPVRISAGSQDFAGSPIRWKGFVDFNPATDRKVDIRTTGELHCWKVESLGTGYWKMSGIDIEYEEAGYR